MVKLRIAVCDDNEIALEQESSLADKILTEEKIEHEVDKYSVSNELLLSQKEYDIMILDIKMEGLDGISLAEKVRALNERCMFFFVTNYWGYLDEAMNQTAYRYWVKPLNEQRFRKALICAAKKIDMLTLRISIHVNRELVQVPAENIVYIYMENKNLHVITRHGELVTSDRLKSIDSQLKEADYFCEVSRGYYVNFYYIISYSDNLIVSKSQNNKYEIYPSRRKYKAFEDKFNNWMAEIK